MDGDSQSRVGDRNLEIPSIPLRVAIARDPTVRRSQMEGKVVASQSLEHLYGKRITRHHRFRRKLLLFLVSNEDEEQWNWGDERTS